MTPPALLSAGSGDLLRCVPCCLLFRISTISSHIRLYFLLRPSAPSPPAAHTPSHAFLTPPAPTPSAAGPVPAAPFYAAAAPASHPPIQPTAPPPQPSASWSHEPLWQPRETRTRLCSAALGPGCTPIRDGLVCFPPLVNEGGNAAVTCKYKVSHDVDMVLVANSKDCWEELFSIGNTLCCLIHSVSTSLTAQSCLKTEFVCFLAVT